MVTGPTCHFGVVPLASTDQVGKELNWRSFGHGFKLRGHRGDGAFLHGDVAVRAMLGSEFGEKQAEELVDLGDGGHGRLAPPAGDPLLDGDTRGKPLDEIHIGLLELLDELPGVRRHAVEEAALSLRKEDVEGKGRFAAATQSGDDNHLVARDVD